MRAADGIAYGVRPNMAVGRAAQEPGKIRSVLAHTRKLGRLELTNSTQPRYYVSQLCAVPKFNRGIAHLSPDTEDD